MFADWDPRSVPSAYRPTKKIEHPLHYVLPTLAAVSVAWFGYGSVAWIIPKSNEALLVFVGLLVAMMVAFVQVGVTLLGAYLSRDRSAGLYAVSLTLSTAMGCWLQSALQLPGHVPVPTALYTIAVVATGYLGRLMASDFRYCEDCNRRLTRIHVSVEQLAAIGIQSPIGGGLDYCESCSKGLIEVEREYVRQYVNGRPEYWRVRLYSSWCTPDTTRLLLASAAPTIGSSNDAPREPAIVWAFRLGQIIVFGSLLVYALVPAVRGTVDWAWVRIDPGPTRLKWYMERNPEGPFADDARRLADKSPSGATSGVKSSPVAQPK